MLKNYEKLEKVLFQAGMFSVKNTVLIGTKGQTGNRLDPIYTRSYNSTKYTDRNQLSVMQVRTSDYLVFGYNNFEAKVNEEIFVSYPTMMDLLEFVEECHNLLNTEGVFTNNSVSSNYQDVAIESAPFAGGKKMIAVPAMLDSNKNDQVRQGILLFLNSEESCVSLDKSAIRTILYILSNFNLTTNSNQLLLMGMALDGNSGSGYTAPSTGFTNTTRQTTTTQKRGLFGNNGGGNKSGLGANKTTRPITSQPQVQQQPQVQESVQQQPPVQEQPTNTPPAGRMSMSNLMNRANEIKLEDIDDVQI